jgi:hypothetical protein
MTPYYCNCGKKDLQVSPIRRDQKNSETDLHEIRPSIGYIRQIEWSIIFLIAP